MSAASALGTRDGLIQDDDDASLGKKIFNIAVT
jgi:hypothetical protein